MNPGFGGQSFISSMVVKIASLRARIQQQGLKTRIQVDGGVSAKTSTRAVEAGADILVAGAAVYGTTDRALAIKAVRFGIVV